MLPPIQHFLLSINLNGIQMSTLAGKSTKNVLTKLKVPLKLKQY